MMVARNLALGLGLILVLIAGFYASDAVLNAYRMRQLPKNFSIVKPGVLYRCGQLRPEHLEKVIRENGIRTVVCLNPHDESREEALVRRLGVGWQTYQMPGSGIGEPASFHDYLRIVGDPDRRPVLVHCAAGAYRTGVAVALYRMLYEAWPFDDVLREMAYSGCRVYAADHGPLIEHLRKTYETIPADVFEQATGLVEPRETVVRSHQASGNGTGTR